MINIFPFLLTSFFFFNIYIIFLKEKHVNAALVHIISFLVLQYDRLNRSKTQFIQIVVENKTI